MLDDPALNAFAAWDRGEPVMVTRGMLQRPDDRQLTGVIAHEMAHLNNRDAQVILATAPSEQTALMMSKASLWISDPGSVSRLPRRVSRLPDRHPPIEQRIAWLRSLEGANAIWADLL